MRSTSSFVNDRQKQSQIENSWKESLSRLVDEVLGGQVVQRRGQRAGRFLVLPELAFQLGTRVLALAQEAQRTAFERRGRKRHLL